jgi:hypothetical protein
MGTRQVHKSIKARCIARSPSISCPLVAGFAISGVVISRYELGQSAPTLNILLRLKFYSQKSIDWILLGQQPGGKY